MTEFLKQKKRIEDAHVKAGLDALVMLSQRTAK
jgi:hypothetical protein